MPERSLRAPRGCAAAILTLLISLAGPALAQPTPAQQDAIRASCRSDAMSTCPGMRGAEALRCLQKNVASLSPACRGAVSVTIPSAPAPAASAPPQPSAPAPAASAPPPPPAPTAPATASPAPAAQQPQSAAPAPAPAAKPAAPAPAPVRPAPAAKSAAPQQAAAPTAPPAAATMSPPPSLRQVTIRELVVIRRLCAGDIEVHCRSVPAGDGRIAACLAARGPALSPGCRRALAPLQN